MDNSVFSREYEVFTTTLRALREEAGLSQSELAKKVQETQTWISKCERGARRVDIIELSWFCDALGITLVQFTDRLQQALMDFRDEAS